MLARNMHDHLRTLHEEYENGEITADALEIRLMERLAILKAHEVAVGRERVDVEAGVLQVGDGLAWFGNWTYGRMIGQLEVYLAELQPTLRQLRADINRSSRLDQTKVKDADTGTPATGAAPVSDEPAPEIMMLKNAAEASSPTVTRLAPDRYQLTGTLKALMCFLAERYRENKKTVAILSGHVIDLDGNTVSDGTLTTTLSRAKNGK